MEFSYGSLYGMTGALALFSDVQAFAKALQVGNLNLNTKTYLLNLYDELLALRKIFNANTTDVNIPHIIVSVDNESQQTMNFLCGYNNYLNYLTETKKLDDAIESVSVDNIELDNIMNSIDAIEESSDNTSLTNLFNSNIDLDNIDIQDLSNDTDTLGLDLDIAEDNSESSIETENKTLFTTYEQVFDPSTNTIDLISWGRLYPQAEISESTYETLTWGQAMRKMKADATGKSLAGSKQGLMSLEVDQELSRDFLRQKEQLPKVIVSYEVSGDLLKTIRKAAGVVTQTSDIDNKNILALLREMYSRAIEPVMLSLGSVQKPKLDLLIDLVEQAIQSTSGSGRKYIGVDVADLQMWNSNNEASIVWRVNNQMAKIMNGKLSEKQLKNLIDECDILLGNTQTADGASLTEDDIEFICSSQTSVIDSIKDILMSKFNIQASLVDEIAIFVDKFLALTDYEQSKRTILQNLMCSRDVLLFMYYLYKAIITAETNLMNTVKNILSSSGEDKEDYNNLFRQFTLNTGICGCYLSASTRMYNMLQQLSSALLKTQIVSFSREKPVYEIMSMVRMNLQSMQDRLLNAQRR